MKCYKDRLINAMLIIVIPDCIAKYINVWRAYQKTEYSSNGILIIAIKVNNF